MKYVLIALLVLAAMQALRGHFHEAVLCLIIASGSLVEMPGRAPAKKA